MTAAMLSARRHVRELSAELATVRRLNWRTTHLEDHITALKTALDKILLAIDEEKK